MDFNFHIKPILSDRCYNCHGPDEKTRKANFRLDIEKEAFANLKSGNGQAIRPGNPSKSDMIRRIRSTDPEMVMPPIESHLEISEFEIALIEKWIDQGAQWKKHWSFIPPVVTTPPQVSSELWTNMNDIDQFILTKANEEGLTIQPQADSERLIRRLYMDLTGLPPSIEEINQYVQDPSIESYEAIVDHLLQSDAHSERMTMEWLDVARYADSHGLHADGWRNMSPWRDWVIKAFKENISYKDFITKQIAGDMLPDATRDDIIATAFNRNHPMTAEGGAVDEEWRLNYVFDRTETMSTALLGLTVGCAKCHDHKYDPISQKEYYQLASFFNNIKEVGMTGDDGDYGPILMLTDKETEKKIAAINQQIRTKTEGLVITDRDKKNISNYIASLTDKPNSVKPIAHIAFDQRTNKYDKKGSKEKVIFDGNENHFTRGEGKLVNGKSGKGLLFEKDYSALFIDQVGQFEITDQFSAGAWINTVQSNPKKTQTIIGNSGEKNNFWRGWDLYLDEQNRVNARLISTYPQNYIHLRSTEVVDTSVWTHLGMSYDASAKASGLSIYINGIQSTSEILNDDLSKSILTLVATKHTRDNRPVKVGESGRLYTGEDGLFYGVLDDIKIFVKALSAYEMAGAAGIDIPMDKTSEQMIALRISKEKVAPELTQLRTEKLSLLESTEELMVMKENSQPNKMYIYHRGEYDKPTEEVYAATPAAVMDFPDGLNADRLGITKWIFDDKNPLTSRVAVNRYWQMIFGRGLVSTPEDFGLQGTLPSHPELLDWLALDFIESGWDMRHLIRLMVNSATYRQSSVIDKENRAKDPENILLARGSSYRWPAEMIRDNALAASGLLKTKIGGHSVKPYQPEGLWIELGNFSNVLLHYKENKGDSLYRRSMYTFLRRTSPPPMMTIFDVPSREVCTIKRENTSTPLQALVLLNDPQFVEAAKVLAQRMQIEGGQNISGQIKFAFRNATGRSPSQKETDLLIRLYDNQLIKYQKNPQEATNLLGVGEYVLDDRLDPAKTAALTMVSNTLLNHDDAYMKR